MRLTVAAAVALVLTFASVARAQGNMSYGTSITAEAAKKLAAPAIAEAKKNNWSMAIAIVDIAGELVYFEKMDDTQAGSVNISIDKARSAARFKRPTKAFQDLVAGGGVGLRVLTLRGAIAVEGGLPIVVDGKIIGAFGVSGGSSEQDGAIAKAALDGLAAK